MRPRGARPASPVVRVVGGGVLVYIYRTAALRGRAPLQHTVAGAETHPQLVNANPTPVNPSYPAT